MKRLYARFVLWMIRPALIERRAEVRREEEAASPLWAEINRRNKEARDRFREEWLRTSASRGRTDPPR